MSVERLGQDTGSPPLSAPAQLQIDIAAPSPRTPVTPLTLDFALLSPPLESAPFPSQHLYSPDLDEHIVLSFDPNVPYFYPSTPPAQVHPVRSTSAPPTVSTFPGSPLSSPPRFAARRSTADLLNTAPKATTSPGGELLPPPPPLFRPTTFWKNTKRSGVTGTSYSPGSHLIRRSTFIAAGLAHDRPCADLSAFGVETRALQLVLPPDSSLTISGSHE